MYILIEERYEDYTGIVDYQVMMAGDTKEDLQNFMDIKGIEDYPVPDGGVLYGIHEVEKLAPSPVVTKGTKEMVENSGAVIKEILRDHFIKTDLYLCDGREVRELKYLQGICFHEAEADSNKTQGLLQMTWEYEYDDAFDIWYAVTIYNDTVSRSMITYLD